MAAKDRKITRRGVQIVLGMLWLLDGALQLQHQMFTSSFANNVLTPAGQGQPVLVSGPVHLGVHIVLLHPAFFNTCFALIQLAIGFCILYKPTVKYGLAGSVVWGLVVWYIGEGLSGLASGHATLLMGAPGAALLYAVIALAVMPPRSPQHRQDNQPAYWLALVWAGLWIGGAIYQLLPGQDSVSAFSSMIAGNAAGAPGWLASLDAHAANTINGFGTATTSMAGTHMTTLQMAQMPTQAGSGYWFILLLALLQLCIGFGVFYKGYRRRLAIGLGVALSLIFWAVGQSFGEYYTGLATDPATAPLFILLGFAILGCAQLDQKLAKLFARIEDVIV